MPDVPALARNYVLACYAVSLVQGQTIRGTVIRYKTVTNYLTAAYKLFIDRRIPYQDKIDKTDYVAIILKAIRDYEGQAKRRNMITDPMTRHMAEQGRRAKPDSAVDAMTDWLMLGRYAGLRKSEWCQSNLDSYERIKRWPGKPAMAFIAADFTFLGKNEEILRAHELTDDLVHYVTICWRHQKNKQHGQKITFARDPADPRFCPVRAALRIYLRSLRLQVPPHEPVGVFRDTDGTRRFITDTMVASYFRDAASKVLRIKRDSPDLQLWSTHSLRVTAANLLHRKQMSDSFIQSRLRWRSNTFLDYLRNTIYAAETQAKALDISDNNLPPEHRRRYRRLEPHEELIAARAA